MQGAMSILERRMNAANSNLETELSELRLNLEQITGEKLN
jgi:hypothetical protein